jgi:crotonobetainyl-CoA:carnitine CoA-transferase CaiB-like acyl-CoA transferase
MGGIMDITGDPDGEPTRIGVAFADVFTGVYSALAVTAALNERERTGKGSHIDMALLDTMVGVLANQALFYLVSGEPPKRMGNAHATVVPYQTFPTTDGWMLIACGNDSQFVKMMALLGDPDMAADERYRTNAARVVNRETLIPRLFELTKTLSKAELAEKFEAAGVPAGPINTLAEVFDDPQVVARGLRVDRPHPAAKGGSIPGVRSPITINGRRAAAARAQPMVGEHTEEILREIGEA